MRISIRQLRHLIKEEVSRGVGKLALCVSNNNPNYCQATLYDPILARELLQKNLKKIGDVEVAEMLKRAVRGYVSISPAKSMRHGECYNAYEVIAIAGKGYGKELYGAGYAMSQDMGSGFLTSDRGEVSPSAKRGWSSAYASERFRTEEFDDKEAPPELQRTPDDPSDDCILHRNYNGKGIQYLNHAYRVTPRDTAMYHIQRSNHEALMKSLANIPLDRKSLEDGIIEAGCDFFDRKYVS